jgi:hypothetical protein
MKRKRKKEEHKITRPPAVVDYVEKPQSFVDNSSIYQEFGGDVSRADGLTAQEEMFCELVASQQCDGDYIKAYAKAFNPETSTAKTLANALLRDNRNISIRINEIRRKGGLSEEKLMKELASFVNLSMGEDNNNKLQAIKIGLQIEGKLDKKLKVEGTINHTNEPRYDPSLLTEEELITLTFLQEKMTVQASNDRRVVEDKWSNNIIDV